MEFVLLRDRVQVTGLSHAVRVLVQRVIPSPDATYTPEYFLPRVYDTAAPRVVACYEEGRLTGVLYTYELLIAGVGTGWAFGGDQMGRGLLVCAPERELEILNACCSFLLENGIHAIRMDWTPNHPRGHAESALKIKDPSVRMKTVADPRKEGDWLPLLPDYDQFLAHLGPHTRRNLRYYRRKVQSAGISYSGMLDASEFREAMRSLNRLADYPMEAERKARDKRYLAAFGSSVIAGLRNSDGEFVSMVTGFTAGTHLHILTQLNGEENSLRKLSLSLVLRGYLIEDFIQRGFTGVHFLEGSSPMLGRFCAPVDLRHISIDRPHVLMSPFKEAGALLAETLYRRGKRVPYRLQWAAGSYWVEAGHAEASDTAAESAISNQSL